MHPIERAALHEAAHALLCHYSPGLPPMRTVAVSADTPGEGEVLLDDAPTEELSEDSLYRWMRMLFAGPLAEMIATGDAPGWHGDLAALARLAERHAIARARGSIRGAPAALELEPLAERLLAPGYTDALRLARRACAAAELLLRARWRAVEHLARYVATDGGVLGAHVAAILAGAPRGGCCPRPSASGSCCAMRRVIR